MAGSGRTGTQPATGKERGTQERSDAEWKERMLLLFPAARMVRGSILAQLRVAVCCMGVCAPSGPEVRCEVPPAPTLSLLAVPCGEEKPRSCRTDRPTKLELQTNLLTNTSGYSVSCYLACIGCILHTGASCRRTWKGRIDGHTQTGRQRARTCTRIQRTDRCSKTTRMRSKGKLHRYRSETVC